MADRLRLLNELSQEIIPLSDGLVWFGELSPEERRAVIRELAVLCIQAGAVTEDVAASILRAKVKRTVTPAVLLSRGSLIEQLAKVGNLPDDEMEKSFKILIALLSIADARRRNVYCRDGCTHWWHNLT